MSIAPSITNSGKKQADYGQQRRYKVNGSDRNLSLIVPKIYIPKLPGTFCSGHIHYKINPMGQFPEKGTF